MSQQLEQTRCIHCGAGHMLMTRASDLGSFFCCNCLNTQPKQPEIQVIDVDAIYRKQKAMRQCCGACHQHPCPAEKA